MAAKRQRSENFTFVDKKHLLEGVESRKNIVECKKIDKGSQKAKEDAWMIITHEFNSISSTPRTPENLKMCWDNMKKRYRMLISNESSGVKSRNLSEYEKMLNEKIGDILTSTQDKSQSSNRTNALNSESIIDGNGDLDDNQSCSSEDSLHSETLLREYSDKWSRIKMIEDIERIKNMERIESIENETSDETKNTVPCVLMLTSHDLNSDSQAQNEDSAKTFEFSAHRLKNGINLETNNHQRNDRRASRSQYQKMKNMNYALAEAKLELAKLAKEHALAEERRKAELHEFQIQEANLKIELLKIQLLNKKSILFT